MENENSLEYILSKQNAFVDELISEAQGDRDFIVRKLDAYHKLAVGSDNAQAAKFLESVADQVEARIGRIPYDYEKYSARELEDFARGEGRINEAKTTALKRLDEDAAYERERALIENDQTREAESASLNSRGLLDGQTRETAVGLGGKEIGLTEQDIDGRMNALTRAVSRDRDDINLNANQGIEDLATDRTRTLEDLRTTARRGVQDTNLSTQLGTEEANRGLDARRKVLERQRASLIAQAPAQASFLDAYKRGYYNG